MKFKTRSTNKKPWKPRQYEVELAFPREHIDNDAVDWPPDSELSGDMVHYFHGKEIYRTYKSKSAH